MSEQLDELKRKVGEARRGLEEAVRRLGALRERLRPRQPEQEEGSADRAPGEAGGPLFPDMSASSGGLDDMELHFEALGTEVGAEDSKREER